MARMTRVSPPELAREFPGPQASMRVTRAPRRTSHSAVHPPKAPAPITAMRGPDLVLADFFCAFISGEAAAPAAARDFRNSRREGASKTFDSEWECWDITRFCQRGRGRLRATLRALR